MDTQKISHDFKLTRWAQVIKEQKTSGKNVKDFCHDNGISRDKYFYWYRKVKDTACENMLELGQDTGTSHKGWMQLLPVQQKDACITVEVSGCSIKVDSDTEPELLKKVCRALRSL